MADLETIERELNELRERLNIDFSYDVMALNYVCLKRHILEAESLSKKEIMRRAKTIKPLVRLEEDYPGIRAKREQLVWIKPYPLTKSYLYCRKKQIILKEGKPLPVKVVKKIAEFTTYHKCKLPGSLIPSASEVLAQIPSSVDMDKVNAFEIIYPLYSVHEYLCAKEFYDSILDRHVLTTILYQIEGGLPEKLKNQEVIWNKEGA